MHTGGEVRELDCVLHYWGYLRDVEYEDHSLLHGHVEPVEVLVHHHCLGLHVRALYLLDSLALGKTTDDDSLVFTQRVDELLSLVDEKTFDFRVLMMCINFTLFKELKL